MAWLFGNSNVAVFALAVAFGFAFVIMLLTTNGHIFDFLIVAPMSWSV